MDCLLQIEFNTSALIISLHELNSYRHWKTTFTPSNIEEITQKMNNRKNFHTFCKMIHTAIKNQSESLFWKVYTFDQIRKIQKKKTMAQSIDFEMNFQTDQNESVTQRMENKQNRLFILGYRTEFEEAKFPLKLIYSETKETHILHEIIRNLWGKIQTPNHHNPENVYSEWKSIFNQKEDEKNRKIDSLKAQILDQKDEIIQLKEELIKSKAELKAIKNKNKHDAPTAKKSSVYKKRKFNRSNSKKKLKSRKSVEKRGKKLFTGRNKKIPRSKYRNTAHNKKLRKSIISRGSSIKSKKFNQSRASFKSRNRSTLSRKSLKSNKSRKSAKSNISRTSKNSRKSKKGSRFWNESYIQRKKHQNFLKNKRKFSNKKFESSIFGSINKSVSSRNTTKKKRNSSKASSKFSNDSFEAKKQKFLRLRNGTSKQDKIKIMNQKLKMLKNRQRKAFNFN